MCNHKKNEIKRGEVFSKTTHSHFRRGKIPLDNVPPRYTRKFKGKRLVGIINPPP
jgi:hypothetical protein